MRQRHALIALPLLVGLDVINEDEEPLAAALEVDLGLLSLAASHCIDVVCCGGWKGRVSRDGRMRSLVVVVVIGYCCWW